MYIWFYVFTLTCDYIYNVCVLEVINFCLLGFLEEGAMIYLYAYVYMYTYH